jgi:hypothetical protein
MTSYQSLANREPKTTKLEPKGSQSERRNFQRHFLRNRAGKETTRRGLSIYLLGAILIHNRSFVCEKSFQNKIAKIEIFKPKSFQNGINIGAGTQQKSCPLLNIEFIFIEYMFSGVLRLGRNINRPKP